MFEIIALVFLTRQIGVIAVRKGLKPGQWKGFLILAWFVAEFIGFIIGIIIFGLREDNLVPLMLLGLISAFGGYLFVRATLLKKPDAMDDDINRIGSDDLRP